MRKARSVAPTGTAERALLEEKARCVDIHLADILPKETRSVILNNDNHPGIVHSLLYVMPCLYWR